MSEALVLTCAKCGARVRIREGEEVGRCEACNTLALRSPVLAASAARDEQPLTLRVVFIGALLLVAAGGYAMHATRKPGDASPTSSSAQVIYAAPPEQAQEAAPAGEVAWDSDSLSPVVLPSSGDAEDFFGFFRVWDGRSAWVAYGGVWSGATLASTWRTEAIDPRLLKREGVTPLAAIAGSRVVVSDTTPNLRVYDLATGNKLATLSVADSVLQICPPKEGVPSRIWVHVVGEKNALIDLETNKATLAPRPGWCAPLSSSGKEARTASCPDDFRNGLAQASCLRAEESPVLGDGAEARYGLKNGASAVILGLKEGRPLAVGVGPGFKPSWVTPLVPDETKPLPEPPHVADLSNGRLYAVYAKAYFDARVAAIDAETGKRIWDVPLVGSLSSGSVGDHGRGGARGLVASKRRVYVARSGGGLDVFDAADGRALGTVGKK